MDLVRVTERLASFLDGEQVPYALVGAHALHAYGVVRATVDLDLLTELRVQDRLVSFLESLGYETLHRSAGYSNHFHPESAWGRVDFVYVDERTSRALFAGSRNVASLGGRELRIPRPEHLVAMKVQAMKNDPSRTFKDLSDIQDLLRVAEIDQEEVRSYFEKAGLDARYEEIRRQG